MMLCKAETSTHPFIALSASFLSGLALAATTGGEFQAFYDFIHGAASGYLGRGLAITGGVFGLAHGIGRGSALPAVLGIILGIFGVLGATIINALFSPQRSEPWRWSAT